MVNATPFRAIFLILAVRETETTSCKKKQLNVSQLNTITSKDPQVVRVKVYLRTTVKFSPTVCELSK